MQSEDRRSNRQRPSVALRDQSTAMQCRGIAVTNETPISHLSTRYHVQF